MKKSISSVLLFAVVLMSIITVPFTSKNAIAAESDYTIIDKYEIMKYHNHSDRVIVSLGDSYSSGEGIDPFFGSELPIRDRVHNADWLCHRSQMAWSGRLELEDENGNTILMKNHRDYYDYDNNHHEGNWYFVAMSGAVTGNILDTDPVPKNLSDKDKKNNDLYKHRFKEYHRADIQISINPLNSLVYLHGFEEIKPQLEIFDQLGNKKADYVTLTMGGNDAHFTEIMTEAACHCAYLDHSADQKLRKLLSKIETEEIYTILDRLEETYKAIYNRAGSQSCIVVAGYPKLLSTKHIGGIFDPEETRLINNTVEICNEKIQSRIDYCRNVENIEIYFTDVAEAFGDRGAYSPDGELINGFLMDEAVDCQDLDDVNPISSDSFHPNSEGAQVYADCVQKTINNLEKTIHISGVVKDEDGQPIHYADVNLLEKENTSLDTKESKFLCKETNNNGYYSFRPIHDSRNNYIIEIKADGYKTLTIDVGSCDKNQNILVNANLEKEGNGVLSGKICKASDRITAISGATIAVYKNNSLYLTKNSNENGDYSVELPVGEYYITITADGYMNFNSYATVTEDTNTYMETFLMIEGSENEKGIAKGTIINSLTGSGTEGVTITVRKDWNNKDENSKVFATTTTDNDGNYSVALPLGNYTVIVSKDGYLTSSFNIIVQSGTTGNQNGTITPKVSGDEYLITLTWGENPSDLDSHVEGMLSNGNSFHVYYEYMKQDDGNIEICKLDYDDTDSFGPEHTTIKITNSNPYYYYIYKYAGDGTVANSGAKVTVHKGNELIGIYNVPTNLGNGDYWNVFAIRNGKLIAKNTITDTPDISYGEQQAGYDIYENADIYVADSIINGMYEKSTGKNSPIKLLQMSLDHKYTYNILAESLCDDYVLSFNSMFWQNIEKTLSFDFISMANWKEMYYEIILMDYLTYSTEQSDFVDEFTLEASSRATDIIMDIFQNQTENVTSDMSKLTDKLKGLSSSWAEEWAEEVDYIKKSDRDTEIFSKGLLNGVTTAYDFIENLSKYLTLKDCKDSTIAYLQKLKEQASGAGDEDLCKAIDSIVKKYNDSFATLVLKDTWEETYKQLSPIVFEGLIKDGIQKSPEVFAKVFGKITGKSTSEIKKLAEGLTEGSTESFNQIMLILKSETFALDLLFNSKDISDANLKLLEFYIISGYSNSAIRDLRDDFLNHKSKETARTFINGFFEYLHFQRYFTDYSYEFVSLSTKEGIWNKIKNYLFETKNEKLYDELTGYLDDDKSFNKNISEAANKLYKTHSTMYGGLTIIDSETGISVSSGNIEAGTTVEVVPIMVIGADGTEGYEITLVKNGQVIQPPKDVLVTIKSNTPNIFVYFVDENGNKINMKAEYCDGCYVFRTSV